MSQLTPGLLKKEIDTSFLDCLQKMAEVTENIKGRYGFDLEAMEAQLQKAIDSST